MRQGGHVAFPVLHVFATEGAVADAHGEAARPGTAGFRAADELEVHRVGFATGPSVRDLVENDLHGVVCIGVVAEAAFLGDVFDDLAGVVLFATNAGVVRCCSPWEQQCKDQQGSE